MRVAHNYLIEVTFTQFDELISLLWKQLLSLISFRPNRKNISIIVIDRFDLTS